ncbi:DMT family transporter [Nioella nitratireducens]|uniref:DMT family transporter n=1 Tax=Nioella nitratireducens TaxID=1287720 RepID=UPI0008FCF884|nr:DMT family transporter [Nioella nitratireducens]
MHDNLRGILLMTLSMAAFALGDVGVKSLSGIVPPGQIMGTMGAVGTLIFALWTRARGLPLFPREVFHPAVGLRFLAEIVAGTGMVLAITLNPLSLATAILQAAPLVVTMGAALIFGERVGLHRWSAILTGLVGVLVILRPGLAGFNPDTIWVIVAMLGLAFRDLATRAAPKGLNNLQLATVGFFALVPTGLLVTSFTEPPLWPGVVGWGWLGFTILATVAGYYTITAAMRVGEIGAVTPFRYSRLIFGMILGMTLFGERPDGLAYLGAAMILCAGLYSAWRERLRR